MRLRITVRRYCLPETPIIWNVDPGTSTISELLTKVNEIVPIESEDWGLEDYAVDLRGSKGVDYECLHFQEVAKVMKEDDEVIIRPLLTQDLKIRRVSGRIQITSDAKHLVDGVPFGRPLLRRPAADRPAVKIPPRKRARITYNNEDERALDLIDYGDLEAENTGNENNRQLVLHADFEDDDSEDDDDFVPAQDDENGDDDDSGTEEDEVEDQEGSDGFVIKLADDEDAPDDTDLNDVPDEETRIKIRKLRSAFPTSPLAVCKYVLNGSGGDVGEAYGTMLLGFQPTKPASAITKITKASKFISKTRSGKRKAATQEVEAPDSMQIEAAETADSLLLEHYDQNGLPPGSISSGKALSVMARAAQGSPSHGLDSRASSSAFNTKSVRFSLDSDSATGFTSTPTIDRESAEDVSEEESDDSSSDSTSSSGTSSSEEDSSSSDKGPKDAQVSDTSSSGSDSESNSDSDSESESSSEEDTRAEGEGKLINANTAKEAFQDSGDTSSSDNDSDSDSDSSSDDELPEKTSSRIINANRSNPATTLAESTPPKPKAYASVPPGGGTKPTKSRNCRRQRSNALNRFKEKGILPAGTTLAEFAQLSEVTDETLPEDALAALKVLRADTRTAEMSITTDKATEKSNDFETRRQALIESLQDGGIDISSESSKGSLKISKPPSVLVQSTSGERTLTDPQISIEDSQDESGQQTGNSVAPTQPAKHESIPADEVLQTAFVTESNSPTPDSGKDPSTATTSRRAKLDLGAGRRLLFGALGIKTPKSKKDEEKIRVDLMKDVRPISNPRVAENALEKDKDVEDEGTEAWKDKITYRAVECCYDGVELSEPPFPFIQRWDPQQQGGWPKSSKRKNKQGDESQYYPDDGHLSKKQKQRQRKVKHNYAEQQEVLDASYEPSYQEDSLMEVDDLSQQPRLVSDDVELEVNQQLMNDLEEASAQVSLGTEDLKPLPEDPSALIDLKLGEAKPGMTIAFKELTMCEETNWQPEISPYRTAVVNAVLHGGELELTIALRDRANLEKIYDTETGERIYGKFDMPDQDEDEVDEDDGIRCMPFGELVEPKIVENAPDDLINIIHETEGAALPKESSTDSHTLSHAPEEEAAEAQLSNVTETSSNSENPDPNPQQSSGEPILQWPAPEMRQTPPSTLQQHFLGAEAQASKQTAVDLLVTSGQECRPLLVNNGKENEVDGEVAMEELSSGPREKTPIFDFNTSEVQVSTDTRLKISQMIKDAGFRSSVPSSVINEIRPSGMESPGDAIVFEKLLKDMTEVEANPVDSPKFHGLNERSPTRGLRAVSSTRVASSSPTRIPQSSWYTIDTGAASSPQTQDEGGSSWQTIDPEDSASSLARSPPQRLTQAVAAPAKRNKFPNLGRAQEMWEALQPKNGETSIQDANRDTSPGLSVGFDGANENVVTTSVQYPKLSVNSSFISQVSDHGHQPDVTFNDSVVTNVETPKVAPSEVNFFMIQSDDAMTDIDEPQSPPYSSDFSKQSQLEDELFLNDELDPPPKPFVDPLSKKLDVLRESSSSDDILPSMEEVLLQREATRERIMPVGSTSVITVEKGKKKARSRNLLDNTKPSQKTSRPLKRQNSPAASQTRKSPRHSEIRGSQSQPSQPRPSHSETLFTSTQQSAVVDLTLSSSELDEDAVVSEVEEEPKKFNKYSLDEVDDHDFVDEAPGWVPKKRNSRNPIGTGRQTKTGLKSSSQSNLNPSRKRTTARFRQYASQ